MVMIEQGYDLHAHTTASDGLLLPGELVALARERWLRGVAVTDHDTVAGVEEAVRAGRELDVDVVPGVEISTRWDGEDVHVLGLWIDPRDETFVRRLASNRDVRRGRNEAIFDKLRELGFDVTLAEAERIAAERRANGDAAVSRPHIAELLVAKGYAASVKEAFDRYLGEGALAYAAVDRIAPEEAIRWIREAGGAAVLAHPGLYRNGAALIERLAPMLHGVEAAHADHDEAQEREFRRLAERFGLAATAGSDFHGYRDGVPFHATLGGRETAAGVVAALQELREKRGKRE